MGLLCFSADTHCGVPDQEESRVPDQVSRIVDARAVETGVIEADLIDRRQVPLCDPGVLRQWTQSGVRR